MTTRILIVEDEAHLAAGIRFNLEAEGYDAEVEADGARALSRLAAADPVPPFDLVILDVMLPGVDGFAVADAMRQAGNFTPVLMLTAKSLAEDVVHGPRRAQRHCRPSVVGQIRQVDDQRNGNATGRRPSRTSRVRISAILASPARSAAGDVWTE